jgi:hypothetical protein
MCVTPDISYLLHDDAGFNHHKEEESESPLTFNRSNNMDANDNLVLCPKEKDPVLTITLDSNTDSGESQ